MIHVIASVKVKPGKRDQLLDLFRENLPRVRRRSVYDIFPQWMLPLACPQSLDEDIITVIETWEA